MIEKSEDEKFRDEHPELYKKTMAYAVERLVDAMEVLFKMTWLYRLGNYMIKRK